MVFVTDWNGDPSDGQAYLQTSLEVEKSHGIALCNSAKDT